MEDQNLEKFFLNGILVDASVKESNIKENELDALIKTLKEKGITFLDLRTLHDILSEPETGSNGSVEIIKNYEGDTSASKPADWTVYFNDRFNRIKNILMTKDSGLMSLSNAKLLSMGSEVKVIAMISNVSISPIKKFMILDIEDNVTSYRALSSIINQDVLQDQIVIIKGKKSKDAIFITEITFPDIQMKDNNQPDIPDAYVLFLSDVHVGSKLFAREPLEKFLKWINGEVEEYSNIAKLVKFIVITGDLVDGIGVYPDQEKELAITDLKKQYEELCTMLARIPKHIKLIISQGNHDATHIAEPQPRVDAFFGDSLYKLENAIFLSNPYQINLIINNHKTNLIGYHGFSIPYYADTIAKYNKMDPDDIEAIMKLHLRSRHLAPTHGSTQVVPLARDYLVIDETPDIYATGHIHKTLVSKYKDTLLINASCWQYQTSYQKKYGQIPDVAKIPVVNLRTKEAQILDFLGEKVQISRKGIKT
jgi:Archaeal DNA polymerase II, small subunit/DNA polymerase delta, subunit B